MQGVLERDQRHLSGAAKGDRIDIAITFGGIYRMSYQYLMQVGISKCRYMWGRESGDLLDLVPRLSVSVT